MLWESYINLMMASPKSSVAPKTDDEITEDEVFAWALLNQLHVSGALE